MNELEIVDCEHVPWCSLRPGDMVWMKNYGLRIVLATGVDLRAVMIRHPDGLMLNYAGIGLVTMGCLQKRFTVKVGTDNMSSDNLMGDMWKLVRCRR